VDVIAALGQLKRSALTLYMKKHFQFYLAVILFGAALSKLLNRGHSSTAADQALGADSP